MKQGGNKQLRLFLESLDIFRPSIEILYHSKAASLYRAKLKKQVENILANNPPAITIAQSLEIAKRVHVELKGSSVGAATGSAAPKQVKLRYSVQFPAGSMGMTVTKDAATNRAFISKVMPGSAAESGGVQVGDFVDGVAGKYITDFDIIMHMIPLMPRPILLQFSREPPSESMTPPKPRVMSPPSLHHTNSSPMFDVNKMTPSNQQRHVSPPPASSERRRRRMQSFEKIKVMLLKSESMAAAEQNSDSGDDSPGSHPAFPAVARAATISSSLPSGVDMGALMYSSSSNPRKGSPRFHRKSHPMQSTDDLDSKECLSDSESVFPRTSSAGSLEGDTFAELKMRASSRDDQTLMYSNSSEETGGRFGRRGKTANAAFETDLYQGGETDSIPGDSPTKNSALNLSSPQSNDGQTLPAGAADSMSGTGDDAFKTTAAVGANNRNVSDGFIIGNREKANSGEYVLRLKVLGAEAGNAEL